MQQLGLLQKPYIFHPFFFQRFVPWARCRKMVLRRAFHVPVELSRISRVPKDQIVKLFIKKVGHSRPLFIYFHLFKTDDSKQVNKCSIQILRMTGFEPRTSDIGGNCSTN